MAFFKFRFPGQSPSTPNEGASSDSLEVVRRRARYRLIGAVVLVFVAVVAFPLLFDTQPRPVSVDTPILIPDRDSTPPLMPAKPVPPSQAPAQPLLPAASVVAPQASLDPGKEEVVLPSASPAAPASAALAQAKPASAPVKTETAPPAIANDGDKAKALLEGKPVDSGQSKVAFQVGAFSDADKVREVRRKLEQAGLKTYIQVLDGKDGKKITRVRVGPFDNRAEADKAAERIRKMDLSFTTLNF